MPAKVSTQRPCRGLITGILARYSLFSVNTIFGDFLHMYVREKSTCHVANTNTHKHAKTEEIEEELHPQIVSGQTGVSLVGVCTVIRGFVTPAAMNTAL